MLAHSEEYEYAVKELGDVQQRSHYLSGLIRGAVNKSPSQQYDVIKKIKPDLLDLDANLSGIKIKFMAALAKNVTDKAQFQLEKEEFDRLFEKISQSLSEWITYTENSETKLSEQFTSPSSQSSLSAEDAARLKEFETQIGTEGDQSKPFLLEEENIDRVSLMDRFLNDATAVIIKFNPEQNSDSLQVLLRDKITQLGLSAESKDRNFVFTEQHAQHVLENLDRVFAATEQPCSFEKTGTLFLAAVDLSMHQLEDDFHFKLPGIVDSQERQGYLSASEETLAALTSDVPRALVDICPKMPKADRLSVMLIADEVTDFSHESPSKVIELRERLQQLSADLQSPGKVTHAMLDKMLQGLRQERFEAAVGDLREGLNKPGVTDSVKKTGEQLIDTACMVRQRSHSKNTLDLPKYLHEMKDFLKSHGNQQEGKQHAAMCRAIKIIANKNPWWAKFADAFVKMGNMVKGVWQRMKQSVVKAPPLPTQQAPRRHSVDVSFSREKPPMPPPRHGATL